MFRYHEMKNIAEDRQADFRQFADNRSRNQKSAGKPLSASSRKPKKYSIAWIVNVLTLGFLS